MRNDEGIVFVMGVIFPRVERLTLPQTVTAVTFHPPVITAWVIQLFTTLLPYPFMGLKTD